MQETHERPTAEADSWRQGEAELVERLRARDEAAFATLLDRYSAAMLRLASFRLSRAAAEEVVQDT